MLKKLQRSFHFYPKQFWLLFSGMLISMLGATMIWPLLMIYVSKRLDLPLAQIASLMTINAAVGLIFTFIAGPVADRLGRKWPMVFGLILNAVAYLFMMRADTYSVFAILMGLSGLAGPLYRVAADAMIADIIPKKQRLDAFALIRMAKNIGVAMGPAIGGIIAAVSYDIAFISAASGMTFFSLLLVFFAKETLSAEEETISNTFQKKEKRGYKDIFQDKDFITMISLYSFGWITSALMWVLLPVYANQSYGIPENLYGLIPATNGLMVILFQLLVTKQTKRFRPMPMIALGMSFYALGTGSVAFASNFWGFLLSIIIVTIGELIIVPTSSAYVANRAHPEMRGRYMGIYNLSWSFASGVGPVMGGLLSDSFGPVSIWYGGFVVGVISTLGLAFLAKRDSEKKSTAIEII